MTPNFGLIIIGDEILSGKRVDKHLPKVIELLAARGLPLAYADYVGDDPARITATLARPRASSSVRKDVSLAYSPFWGSNIQAQLLGSSPAMTMAPSPI